MDKPEAKEGNEPILDSQKKNTAKKQVGRFLGYEVSAPAEMKNPTLRLFLLIFANVLLLIILRVAISN